MAFNSVRLNIISLVIVITVIAASALTTACTAESPEPVTVWTSETSVADYFAWYNSHEDGPPVEITPIERGSGYDALREADQVPDILIDRHLLKPDAGQRYASLEETVSDQRDVFYRPLIRAGIVSEKQRLIPLSFDVPAVMFSTAYTPAQDSHQSIELEELASAAVEFNEWEDERAARIGYSPLWQEEFVRTVLESFGTRFRTGPEALPLWSRESVDDAINFMRTWSENNEGVETEQEFQERYLVAPGNRGVQEQQVGFWHTSASRFYSLPDEERDGLDVRWIAHEGRLPVADRVLWTGIPAGAKNSDGAREVLAWLFDEHTQAMLVREVSGSTPDSFGFAGGFSAISSVNHRDLIETSPELTGRIPVEEQLPAPVTEHVLWPRVREQAAVPWAVDTIRGEADDSLRERLHDWIRRQEP